MNRGEPGDIIHWTIPPRIDSWEKTDYLKDVVKGRGQESWGEKYFVVRYDGYNKDSKVPFYRVAKIQKPNGTIIDLDPNQKYD